MSVLLLLQLIGIWSIFQSFPAILISSNVKVLSVSIHVHRACHYQHRTIEPQLETIECHKECTLNQMSSPLDWSTGLPALNSSYAHKYSTKVLHNLRSDVGLHVAVQTCPFDEKTCLTLQFHKLRSMPYKVHTLPAKPRRRTRRGCRAGKATHTNSFSELYVNSNCVKFCVLNTRSVRNKTTEVVDFVIENNFEIVALCESWIKAEDTAY